MAVGEVLPVRAVDIYDGDLGAPLVLFSAFAAPEPLAREGDLLGLGRPVELVDPARLREAGRGIVGEGVGVLDVDIRAEPPEPGEGYFAPVGRRSERVLLDIRRVGEVLRSDCADAFLEDVGWREAGSQRDQIAPVGAYSDDPTFLAARADLRESYLAVLALKRHLRRGGQYEPHKPAQRWYLPRQGHPDSAAGRSVQA
jgi:hypothetical protein